MSNFKIFHLSVSAGNHPIVVHITWVRQLKSESVTSLMTQEVIMLRAELSEAPRIQIINERTLCIYVVVDARDMVLEMSREAQRIQIINERTLCIYVVVDARDISSTMVAKTIVCV
jgi:hypothetical protein